MASLISDPTPMVLGYDPLIQLVHEDDMARAMYLAIVRDLPGAYNVVSDEPQAMSALVSQRGGRTIGLPYPLVKALMAVTWRLGQSSFAPEWVDLSRYSLVASNARLKAAGWEPQYTTAQAFRALIEAESGHNAVEPGFRAQAHQAAHPDGSDQPEDSRGQGDPGAKV
jgi:UDP-glucose 4-epimerase